MTSLYNRLPLAALELLAARTEQVLAAMPPEADDVARLGIKMHLARLTTAISKKGATPGT